MGLIYIMGLRRDKKQVLQCHCSELFPLKNTEAPILKSNDDQINLKQTVPGSAKELRESMLF
jgi:hypothetical protein